MNKRVPAEVFPPGEFLADELVERGWTPEQLATRAGVPLAEIQAVLDGGRVNVRLSERLGYALGTNGAFWANLSLYYVKHKGGAG